MTVRLRRFADLAGELSAAPGPVRLVGVDGCGGAGKTTFAARLAAAAGDCPVVHTDDFASHDEPLEWWPRLLRDVIEPLLSGEAATFHPYDWVARRRSDVAVVVAPAPLVVIEGVGATRSAWRDLMTLAVWVDAPRPLRLQRGLARDGAHLLGFWEWWMAQEDDYVAAERPHAYADLVVDGTSEGATDRPDVFVEIAVSAPR